MTGCGIRVIRKGKVVHTGTLDSLRRVKEIVKEVCFQRLHLVLFSFFCVFIF